MENLLEYCTDLLDENGQLEESFDFNTLEDARLKYDELHTTEMSGLFVQIWHRESEDNPVCLLGSEIV